VEATSERALLTGACPLQERRIDSEELARSGAAILTTIARGIFTSVQDLSRKLLRYIRAYFENHPPLQNGSIQTCEGESSHANELAATGH
jgi:hypothetical protein